MQNTQQVTFKDFVLEMREWKKWVTHKIEAQDAEIKQLRIELSSFNATLNDVRDEVTHQLAEASASVYEVSDKLSELLAGMPDDEEEDEAGDDVLAVQELEDIDDSDVPTFLGEGEYDVD